MAATAAAMARGRPMLSPRLTPPSSTEATATLLPMALVLDTATTPSLTLPPTPSATTTARGLLRHTAVAMEAMVDTATARGRLRPSPRPMLLSSTEVTVTVLPSPTLPPMASATAMASATPPPTPLVTTTARGPLRRTVVAMEDAAMVATVVDMARGRLSPTVAMVATAAGTTVELRSKRSELSLYPIDLYFLFS